MKSKTFEPPTKKGATVSKEREAQALSHVLSAREDKEMAKFVKVNAVEFARNLVKHQGFENAKRITEQYTSDLYTPETKNFYTLALAQVMKMKPATKAVSK